MLTRETHQNKIWMLSKRNFNTTGNYIRGVNSKHIFLQSKTSGGLSAFALAVVLSPIADCRDRTAQTNWIERRSQIHRRI